MATEGSIVSEQEAKELSKPGDIDFPMPGEVSTKVAEAEHAHTMPEDVEFIGEDGKEL